MSVDINFLAVIAGVVINMVLGSIWYAPKVFGTKWMTSLGINPEQAKQGRGKAYGWMIFASIVTVLMLAMVVDWANATSFGAGAWVGFLVWLGFILTYALSQKAFAKTPSAAFTITMGYQVVSLVLVGGVLAIWA